MTPGSSFSEIDARRVFQDYFHMPLNNVVIPNHQAGMSAITSTKVGRCRAVVQTLASWRISGFEPEEAYLHLLDRYVARELWLFDLRARTDAAFGLPVQACSVKGPQALPNSTRPVLRWPPIPVSACLPWRGAR